MEKFPNNDSMFSSQRLYAEGKYGTTILSTENGANILTKTPFEEWIFVQYEQQSDQSCGAGWTEGGRHQGSVHHRGWRTCRRGHNGQDRNRLMKRFRCTHWRRGKWYLETRFRMPKQSDVSTFQEISPDPNEWLNQFHEVLYAEANNKKVKGTMQTS